MSLESELTPQGPRLFQTEISYSNPHLRPAAVAEGTSNIFDMYFNYGLPHFEVARNYLLDYTLPFIDSVRFGFARHPERVDRVGVGSWEDYLRIRQIDRSSALPADETLEALDVSLLTMGIMPDLVVQKYVDVDGNEQIVEFSRRGMLQPPETLEETRLRLRELWVETLKIARQETSPTVRFYDNPAVMRTALFFDVCRRLPVRNSTDLLKDEEAAKLTALADKFSNPLDR